MHDRFVIACYAYPATARLWTGSWNLTTHASASQLNNALVIQANIAFLGFTIFE